MRKNKLLLLLFPHFFTEVFCKVAEILWEILESCSCDHHGKSMRKVDWIIDTTNCLKHHYNDVIMSAMASQITGLTIVYSSVCSRADKKISKLRVTGFCEGNSPVTSEFPAQRASNTENVSIWWRLHVNWPNSFEHCIHHGRTGDNSQVPIYIWITINVLFQMTLRKPVPYVNTLLRAFLKRKVCPKEPDSQPALAPAIAWWWIDEI